MRKLSLENRAMSVDMLPDCGGAIAALRLKTDGQAHDLLMPANSPDIEARNLGHMACIPLAPFATFTRDGYLRFGGETVELAAVADAARHLPTYWMVQDASDTRATLSWYHEPGLWGWPWGFQILQRLRLSEDGLEIYIALTNIGAKPMPAGIGLRFTLDCSGQAVLSGAQPAVATQDSGPVLLGVKDMAFNARPMDGNLRVQWPQRRRELDLALGGPFAIFNLRCRSSDQRAILQPATHSGAAFAADGAVREGGMAILQQGDSLAGTVTLSARTLPR